LNIVQAKQVTNMIYLLNSFPNSIWENLSQPATVRNFSPEYISGFLLKHKFVSAVGHESTADLYSRILEIQVQCNRFQVAPKAGDVIIAGLFTSSVRLEPGQKYTEEQILKMPINWCVINF
jgi:hypothetical protein